MATVVPAPVLDSRDGDLVTAEAIGSLPSELSDRSNSNPAVVFLEAAGAIFDKLLFQLNQWPSAVIQKVLNLCGVKLIASTGATVQQSFTLSAPQPLDAVIPAGSQVGTSDGSIVFATLADTTVRAYTAPAGTIDLTSGSTAVTGSGTAFTTDALEGYQISVAGSGVWYTVADVIDDTTLTLASSAASSVSGQAYYAGPVTATIAAQATTQGLATNVAAAALTTLISQPAGVASTTNNAAATGGTDLETVASAIARAPTAFAARDSALSTSDYEYFAQTILGANSRAKGFANTNVTAAAPGYVTLALLSPAWTTSSSVSAQERASVVRDLAGRSFVGATLTDVAANIQRFDQSTAIPSVLVWRNSASDETSVRLNVAAALNDLLNPSTYPWGRTVHTTDLVKAVRSAAGVDRVHSVNGIPAIAMNYIIAGNSISFTAGSTSATANAGDIGAGKITANVTYLIDTISKSGYLVTAISSTTLTLSAAWTGATSSVTSVPYINVGDTALTNAYSLPYSNLSTTVAPASIVVVGSVAS